MDRTIIALVIEEHYRMLLDLDAEIEASEDQDDRANYDNVRADIIETELRQLASESLNYWAMTGEGPC